MPTIPTVHLNGTDRATLYSGYFDAAEALYSAFQAVQRTAPNGRDYYPQGDRAIDTALAEHKRRLERIDAVLTEIKTIALEMDGP